jgi:alcohol dehydrogenase (NADP+)
VVAGLQGSELTPSTEETWKAMERLKDIGLCKSIGVSNFTVKKLEEMKPYVKIIPSVNQVELHPKWPQEELLTKCREMCIHCTAYAPIGSMETAEKFKHSGPTLLEDPNVLAIAEQIGRTPAQVCLRWGLQRGTSVIPKSSKEKHLKENKDLFSFKLSNEQMARLFDVDPKERLVKGTIFLDENGRFVGGYSNLNHLWDGEL